MRTFLICFDLAMAAILLLTGRWFYRCQGRGFGLLAGFNTLPAARQAEFDHLRLCQDYGKRMMLGALPFLLAAGVDAVRPELGCLSAWGVFTALLIWHCVDINRHQSRYLR